MSNIQITLFHYMTLMMRMLLMNKLLTVEKLKSNVKEFLSRHKCH